MVQESKHDEAEGLIESITASLRYTVENAKDSLAATSNLADAFDDIDQAFSQVIDVLDRFNERLTRLESAAGRDVA